jgi:hypothetical protein
MFENVFRSLKAFKDTVTGEAARSKGKSGASASSGDGDFKPQRISRLIDIIQPTAMTGPTPEEICGVTEKMAREQVRQRLALLYRRYNRAASSLDPKLRHEAERMLDAIVTVRENVFGPI